MKRIIGVTAAGALIMIGCGKSPAMPTTTVSISPPASPSPPSVPRIVVNASSNPIHVGTAVQIAYRVTASDPVATLRVGAVTVTVEP